MSLIESIMLSVALAMDCFTVSISCGIIHKKMGSQVLVMALLFGLFQAGMPMLGWLAADVLSNEITAYDHWVAFGLLSFLGGRMIYEGGKAEKEECRMNPTRFLPLLTLALATSIDALAVGFSFIGMNMRTFADVLPTIIIIGIGSFLFTLLGKWIGVRIGRKFDWPAEQLGGVILIVIGVRVLFSHLCV